MSTSTILIIVFVIAAIGAVLGYRRARGFRSEDGKRLHSRPVYHASYVVSWALIPSLLVLAAWLIVSPILIQITVRGDFPDNVLAQSALTEDLAYGMIESLGAGLTVLPDDERAEVSDQTPIAELTPMLQRRGMPVASATADWMVPLALQRNALQSISGIAMTVTVILLAAAGAFWGYRRLALRLRARNQVESVVNVMLIVASSIAILTTVGIIFSMLFETIDFFGRISPMEFFFGTTWEPRFSAAGSGGTEGQFGLIPLLAGTLYIGSVAMLVAVPIGLFAAIYMAEYARNSTRSVVKPLLEILAGIPTIVYGFFALVTVGPFLRDLSSQLSGLVSGDYAPFIQAQSVLTAGLVMGIMLIPFVSSLSDDIITSVPRSLRDGALGLGATRSEMIKQVVLPAALPGIVSALLLTASRAIGETMIVVLAAGVAATITINPFEAMTTITVKIVQQLTGDLEFTSPQTLVAFALGITLFVITLCLNVYALYIVRKYKEQYE
ncbi:phosphate ABC transporter permease subunit PstC [Fulvimarina sp. 2208YS6-2-32]|uniref:Phosphate transport system permease protein n=1 Tax=Fulvimarina uroteuthidis TaxID=3098149 RepID=A0ABU5I0J6_9HYPH|nr:phosphate ABC transporter permease subunit PstC [Fulvimarina sp. 2208YS6-2-32]MDY8108642.1 phosphate ABC transporter permease subunit PstC [Fulvimarina sp. 2208YS6-2-32]